MRLEEKDMWEMNAEKSQCVLEVCENIFKIKTDNLELTDDSILQTVVFSLSYYWHIRQEDRCLIILNEICRNPKVNIDTRIFLYWQLGMMGIKKEIRRKTYKTILKTVERTCKVKDLKQIELNKRDKKRIVFITNQFLSYQHSPTKLLLNIVKAINDTFEEIEEVYIFSSTGMPIYIPCFFYKPYIYNCMEFKQEIFENILCLAQIDRCGVGYEQNIEEKNSVIKLEAMVKQIYDLKPYTIISIGGENILADLCNKFIEVYTYATVRGIPITNTKYLVNSTNTTCVKKTQFSNTQELVEIPFGLSDLEDKYDEIYTRELLGLPKEAFLISVVGNRLGIEVTEEFLKVCESIVINNENVGIVFIGEYDKDSIKSKIDIKAYDKIYTIGYRKNLIAAVKLTDMFLNPTRYGGGYGAMAAILCGIPIISTDTGDVAAYLNEKFKVANYVQMIEVVSNIIINKDKYMALSKDIKAIYEIYKENAWDKFLAYIFEEYKKEEEIKSKR